MYEVYFAYGPRFNDGHQEPYWRLFKVFPYESEARICISKQMNRSCFWSEKPRDYKILYKDMVLNV